MSSAEGTKVSRRKFVQLGTGAIVAAAAIGAGAYYLTQSQSKPQQTINVSMGLGAGWFSNTPYLMSDFAGIYTKNGLATGKFPTFANPALMFSALQNGDIHIMTGTGGTDVAWHQGVRNFKIYAITSVKSSFMLIGNKNITTLDQLKGKTVATSGSASPDDYQLKYLLKSNGIDANSVHFVGMAPANRFAALKAGTLDTAVMSPTDNVAAVLEGYPLIIKFAPYVPPLTFGGIVAKTSTAQDNPELIKRVLKSAIQGIDIVNTDKASTAKMWTSKLENYPYTYTTSTDVANKSWDDFGKDFFSYSTDLTNLQNFINLDSSLNNWTSEIPRPEDLTDFTLLKQVLKEMGKA